MSKEHEVLVKLKDLASQLGRMPTRDEYAASYGFDYRSAFGSYSVALRAAGADGREMAKKHKEVNPLLRSILDVKPIRLNSKYPILGKYPKIVCIGDIHAPWACKDSLDLIYKIIKEVQPDYVVTMGDEFDFFSMSRFPKQILFTPKEEVDAAEKQLKEIFEKIHASCPTAKKYAIRGNHSIRPIKTLIEAAPQLVPFFDLDRYFKFPHCETILDTREILEISGIAFIHGYMNHGSHMKKIGKPVVHGHLHRGQLTVTKHDGKWLFELDAGYVGNPSAVCFNYTSIKETRWTRGVGLITEFGPHFIPFE